MPITAGESFFETLLQFEGSSYKIKNEEFIISKVMHDHLILSRSAGDYFIIPFSYVKFVKTKKGGQALDWIVFHDNKQLPV